MDGITASFGELKLYNDSHNRSVRKKIGESLNEISQYLNDLYSYDLLLQEDDITIYLNQILDRIVTANPELKSRNLKLFTLRTDEPNASTSGEGIIMFNLGLLARLQTEEDVAFIICHEIAHDMQQHVLNSVVARAEILGDKEFQKEVKKISKLEYNRLEETLRLMRALKANYAEHSRSNESEADSIGFFLFKNAGYDVEEAAMVMVRLDSVDAPIYKKPIDFHARFNFGTHTFKDSWLKDQSALDIGGNLDGLFVLPDSLKTHPDCMARAEALNRMAGSNQGKAPTPPLRDFSKIKRNVHFERLEMFLFYENFDEALFTALQLLNEYPENLYLHNAVVECFLEIYDESMEHRFAKVVAFPGKEYTRTYNQVLNMLHTMRASEIKELVKAYAAHYLDAHRKDHAYAGYVTLLVEVMDTSKEKRQKMVKSYSTHFDDAYYDSRINKKFNLN